MEKAKAVLGSRKFWAAVVALVLAFFGERAGISGDQLSQSVQVLIAYIVGQGLADIRK